MTRRGSASSALQLCQLNARRYVHNYSLLFRKGVEDVVFVSLAETGGWEVFALDALLATYPDALVVQCHRPAETIMASMCSLAQHTTEGWSNTFTGDVIGADSMETWSRGLELFNTERAKHDPAQFYDLDYVALIKDPVAAVEDIYRAFGIDFTDAARESVRHTHDESKQGPRAPKHTYSLADYGLTDEQVRERFRNL